MRPHRLRVTAFGAFGGTVQVCFDDLAFSGLFLLHGETGAGKTTLLDAIGFALYGRVPGERGKARRLRSDHAAPGTPTEVQLEATLGGRRMRITRKPEQERAKLRGAGTTTEQAKVLLEEFTGGSWRAVSTRMGEADAEIADLMGMSADQFFQVVLLPQGEFARFLHADAGDRAKLLQRLFGTDRFHAVEEWLARRRKATADEVREAEFGISGLLARVAQAAGVPCRAAKRRAAKRRAAKRCRRRVRCCRRLRCRLRRSGPHGSPGPRPRKQKPARARSPPAARTSTGRSTGSARPGTSLTGSGAAPRPSGPGTTWPRPKPASATAAPSSPPRSAPPTSATRSQRPNEPAPRSPGPAPPRTRPGGTPTLLPALPRPS